jgi:neutral trehalase
MKYDELLKSAKSVLKYNDVGEWTRPAPDLYPHQWLWDSCFTAIGLSNYDIHRAQQEIISLFRGQWSNGMVPNMIFTEAKNYHISPNMWNSKESIYAPNDVETSGITQPPMLAEAIVRIGSQLKAVERRKWYRKVWPNLIAYHEWMYRERNPHAEGLVVLIHPWETGQDNTPPWMTMMHEHQKPYWIKLVELTRADKLIEKVRRDTRQVPPDERISTVEALMLYSVVRRLRRKQYDTHRILLRSHFIIEDLFFNSILIRANELVKQIADDINEEIPAETLSYMNKATKAINDLRDDESGMYFSRMFITRDLIKEPTIATLLPLYSGTISKEHAKQLVAMLKNDDLFYANFPVPSVPLNSPFFNHRRYWQGPTWVNTNWLIIDGLERYGFTEEAAELRNRTIEMVSRSGFSEYFSPIDGYGAGIAPFSWTAALTIDLLENTKK